MRRHALRFLDLIARVLERRDYAEEIVFWKEILASCPETIADPHYRAEAFPKYLRLCIDELKEGRERQLKLVEIGSGPLSILASGIDQGLFDITAIDPLAQVYNKLMRQNGLSYPVKPVRGFGEKLLSLLGEGEC